MDPPAPASCAASSAALSPADSLSPPLASDVLVVGTGLSACVCAAALARRGARVVQVEESGTYGGAYQSMRLSELIDWALAGECAGRNNGEEGRETQTQVPDRTPILVLEKSEEENAVSLACRVAEDRLEDQSEATGQGGTDACTAARDRECPDNAIDKRASEPFLSPTQFQPRGGPGRGFGDFFSRHVSFFPFAEKSEVSGVRPGLASGSDVRGVRAPASVPGASSVQRPRGGDTAPPRATQTESDSVWRKRTMEALLQPSTSNGFSLDLLPRILYSNSPMVNILVESGAARYLEFRPLEAPVYVADLEMETENFTWGMHGDRHARAHLREDAEAGGRAEKRGRSACAEHTGRTENAIGSACHEDGSDEVKRRKTGVGDAAGANRPAGHSESSATQRSTPLLGRGGSPQVGKDGAAHMTLEAVPLSRSAIFGSSVLTLREKRSLMKFVSGVASQFLSPQFLSAAHCWGRKENGSPKGRAATPGRGEAGARGGLAGDEDEKENLENGEGSLSWEAFLRRHDLTERLQRYLTFGVCLSEFPLLGATGAAARVSPVSSLSPRALSDEKALLAGSSPSPAREANSLPHSLVCSAREGQRRLELFVQSVGVYSRQTASDGAWLYPLFGTSDLPQAFARVASLSEAVCMLRAGIQEVKVWLRDDAALRGLEADDGLPASDEGATEKERTQRRRPRSLSAAAPEADFCDVARERGKELEVHLTNGERVRTHLILFESDSLPAMDTPVWNTCGVKAGARRGSVAERPGGVFGQKAAPASLRQTLFGESLPEDNRAASDPSVSTGSARGRKSEEIGGRARPASTDADTRGHPRDALKRPARVETESVSLFSCHLIAICRKPVLDGPGFRMCVCSVRAGTEDAREVQTEDPKARKHLETDATQRVRGADSDTPINSARPFSTARWPVHILQTDASCATAPRDFTVLHLVHVGCPAVGPCGCWPPRASANGHSGGGDARKRKAAAGSEGGGLGTGDSCAVDRRRDGEEMHKGRCGGSVRTQGSIPCKILREVLRSLLERAQDGKPDDDCLLACSFVFCPAVERPRDAALAERASKRFEGFLRGFREGPLMPVDALERIKRMRSGHAKTSERDVVDASVQEPNSPSGAGVGTAPRATDANAGTAEAEAICETTDDAHGVNHTTLDHSAPARDEPSAANEETAGERTCQTLSATTAASRKEDKDTSGSQVATGAEENNGAAAQVTRGTLLEASGVKGCGFALLPSAPVTPFFSLLSEPVACRDVLSSLLAFKETLKVDDVVPKHILQGLEEVEELQRAMNAPYEQLDKLGISATREGNEL
ncbi:conserved hypothetical protein [Neospora caninum Liverpool]|uniref:GDP dissociation inhibitor n=1 Tax=Neospora caninum (strain Liverpool) TaxID=572307 RepID=F0V9Z5_NEOCL|nr:conserved hypothetical protein [Neospora caninum Liverpool]CBZ50484.1 conserved hypothetical protein [Neospora caninum Liverpool]CEL65094.1 TPA: hypothetical protein BN1204_009530 [Neospora caninum Liverpool]|eukprot:XP_003880517.1 conserved hypothetical protein [Neospora caninum Liverpool]